MKSLRLVLVLVICQYVGSDVPDKLHLSVYYESKCPDSRKFVVEQLVPTMNLLKDHLILSLVPFGKAYSINNGYDGFQCQHGPSECLGNLVQNCALHHMQGRPDTEKVAYVACEMVTLAGTRGNLMCVHNANLPVDLIHECITSNVGTELQLNSEYDTKRLTPKFIPTVTINKVFNQQIQDYSQVDLVGTICSLMKDVQSCAAHYNQQALQYIIPQFLHKNFAPKNNTLVQTNFKHFRSYGILQGFS